MAKIFRVKLILVCLLLLCTMSIIFYMESVSQLGLDGSGGALTYSQPSISSTSQVLLTHMTYVNRQERLQKMCQLYAHKNDTVSFSDKFDKEMFDHILVDEKHRLLYCYVPKVACTNWKRIFMILTGKANVTNILEIPAAAAHEKGIFTKLCNYSHAEIDVLLQTYTKFLFVRHPLERLLSAYRNKLEQHYLSSKYFQARFGRYIIKNFRSNASKESLEKGDDVTFAEFATYLTSRENVFNEHWKPIHELCHPCVVNYDIIGKYESLYEDSEFILRRAGESRIEFPHRPKPSSTSLHLKKYFGTLSDETVKQLHDIYTMDFELFGYNLEEYL